MKPIKYCDGAGGMIECPHPVDCMIDCQFNISVVTRTIKPYPAVPDDIEPVQEEWHTVGVVAISIIMAALAIVCLLIFFTGVYMWSLLI
jgi:hypothetical protein